MAVTSLSAPVLTSGDAICTRDVGAAFVGKGRRVLWSKPRDEASRTQCYSSRWRAVGADADCACRT